MKLKQQILTLATIFLLALSVTILTVPASAKSKDKTAKPKITMKQAREAAIKAVPEGKIKSGELETEEGKRVYSFDVKTSQGIREVWIDPDSGEVIKNELETPEQEKAEKAADQN